MILEKERKVEYTELIYDLIFVYVAGRNNSLLQNITNGFVSGNMLNIYFICSLVIVQIWMFSTYYINMFGRNKLRDHIFMFINMYLLYYIAEGTRLHWEGYRIQYHVAWGLILINIGVQYLIELKNHKDDLCAMALIKRIAAVLFIESIIVFAAIPVYEKTGIILEPFAILAGVAGTILSNGSYKKVMVDFNHLSERAMLYVVFTFGEMIIAAASYFEGRFDGNMLYFSLMCFLIIAGLFLNYELFYDHIIDREIQTNGMVYMLVHIFIILALNCVTTSLEFMRNEEVELTAKIVFMTISLLVYYLSTLALGSFAKKSIAPTKRNYIGAASIAAGFAALMILFRFNMYVTIAINTIYVYIVFFILWFLIKKAERTEIN